MYITQCLNSVSIGLEDMRAFTKMGFRIYSDSVER